jgi:hypothetical protein
VAAVAEPAAELAEGDHAREDQADNEHRLDDLLALFGGGLREWEQRAERHPRATLPDSPAVGRHRTRNRVGPRGGVGAAEGRRGRRPGLSVAGKSVRAQLGAARDQGRQVGDGLDRPDLRNAHQAVRVEVVAEEERGVAVGGGEEPRAAEVEQVPLVDRLEPEGVGLFGQRGEDSLQLALVAGPERVGPEAAFPRRVVGDRPPQIGRYSQVASSFVQ